MTIALASTINNILGGAVNEDDDFLSGNDEGLEVTEEDLDALATAQEAEAVRPA